MIGKEKTHERSKKKQRRPQEVLLWRGVSIKTPSCAGGVPRRPTPAVSTPITTPPVAVAAILAAVNRRSRANLSLSDTERFGTCRNRQSTHKQST
jgi:hypothetical protein